MVVSPASQEARQQRRRFNDDQLVYFMIKSGFAEAVAMDEVRRAYGLPRHYARERFHVTLIPLGDIRLISAEAMKAVRSAAASLQAEPFAIAFHRLDGNVLKGKNMGPAKALQQALVERLEAFGIVLPDYACDPHVTLAYTEWQQRNIVIDPIGWTVRELLLVNSIHGKGHEPLGSWPLIARQGLLPF